MKIEVDSFNCPDCDRNLPPGELGRVRLGVVRINDDKLFRMLRQPHRLPYIEMNIDYLCKSCWNSEMKSRRRDLLPHTRRTTYNLDIICEKCGDIKQISTFDDGHVIYSSCKTCNQWMEEDYTGKKYYGKIKESVCDCKCE